MVREKKSKRNHDLDCFLVTLNSRQKGQVSLQCKLYV